ncbi:MAG: hypothetical protein M9894_30580 [Planctomycetes bacterium]|nr:hypothetical protein [Planctomycetota bacterium]
MVRLTHVLAVLGLVVLPGCLEREERITVSADGALDVVHVFKGDPGDFAPGGDALPAGAPWLVTERDAPRDDGRVERVREARARFAGAADVPEGFGAPGDEASLRFTTSLAVERLPDGATRYTFERRYAPRVWAWRERLFEEHLPQALRDRLASKDGAPLDPAARREGLAGLLAFERAKGQALLERALATTAAPGEDRAVGARRALRARAGYAAAFDGAWRVDDLVGLLEAPRQEQVALEARYRAETRRAALAAGVDAAVAEGAAPGARPALEAALGAALDLERARLEATEDLQDERFVVRVTFPGAVVLSDAVSLEDGGRTAVFRFDGKALNDRPQVLRAVAVLRR